MVMNQVKHPELIPSGFGWQLLMDGKRKDRLMWKIKFNSEKFRKDIYYKRVIEDNKSLSESAKDIGISKATLSRLERGRRLIWKHSLMYANGWIKD